MKQIKYPKLTNHYNVARDRDFEKQLDKLYYATEKIHGSNICIAISRETVDYFSRNMCISNSTSGFMTILSQLKEVSEIIEIAREQIIKTNIEALYIYGELFGASIQKMDYIENKENRQSFRIFDVFEVKNGEVKTYSYEQLNSVFVSKYLVPSYGSFKTLRELLLLETLENSFLGGKAEGLVYKPVNSMVLTFSSSHSVDGYFAVKHKTEAFLETKGAKPKILYTATADELNFQKSVEQYITEQRLNNLLSKGDYELVAKNIGKIITAYIDDVEEDYNIDGHIIPFNRKRLRYINKQIVELIKSKINSEN